MNLSIELLKTFTTVVEEMNFTRAADRLYKTQSAVSLQMKRLAEEVGKPIFCHAGKKLFLTETGEKLHFHAIKILCVHDEACSSLAEPMMTGVVNIGASEDYANTLIPPLLADFAEKYPNITIGLQCSPSVHLKEMLDNGLLDIAILAEHEEGGRLLKYEPIQWLAAASYNYDGGEIPLAVYPDYCAARRAALAKLREQGYSYRVAYESQSMSIIKAAVKSGAAVAPVLSRVGLEGYRLLDEKDGFPLLPHIPITLHVRKDGNSEVIATLEDYIIKAFQHELSNV